jgi:hypothetical protein
LADVPRWRNSQETAFSQRHDVTRVSGRRGNKREPSATSFKAGSDPFGTGSRLTCSAPANDPRVILHPGSLSNPSLIGTGENGRMRQGSEGIADLFHREIRIG